MGTRAQAVARTRKQIIDATARRIRSSPEPLTLAHLAVGAGVSRATLYRHFASVTDLLDGVAADLLARARFDRLLAALELDDPVEALRQVTIAGTGIWATDTTLVRNLFSLARAQPEALPVITQLENGRRDAMEHLATRLNQAGRLRGGLARDRAVDLLLVITAFAAWDELLTTRNRSPPPRPPPSATSPSGRSSTTTEPRAPPGARTLQRPDVAVSVGLPPGCAAVGPLGPRRSSGLPPDLSQLDTTAEFARIVATASSPRAGP